MSTSTRLSLRHHTPTPFNTIARSHKNESCLMKRAGVSPSKLSQEDCTGVPPEWSLNEQA